jgi:hypothetical protein
MRANPVVLAMILISGSLSAPIDVSARAALSPAAAPAQSELAPTIPIEGLSISRQSWLREGGAPRASPSDRS